MEQKAHKQKRGGGPHMQAQFYRRGMSHCHCLQTSDTRLFSLCMKTCTSDMTGSFQTSNLRLAPDSVLRLPSSQTEQLYVFWIPTLQPTIVPLSDNSPSDHRCQSTESPCTLIDILPFLLLWRTLAYICL